jgi:hypothetical protein
MTRVGWLLSIFIRYPVPYLKPGKTKGHIYIRIFTAIMRFLKT